MRGTVSYDNADEVGAFGEVVFDCTHPASLARFWAAALDGYQVAPYDDAELARLRAMGIDDPEDDPSVLVEPISGSGPRLWFTRVPEPKTVKNRVHLDVRAADVKAEVERLVGLALASAGVSDGHVAVEYVGEARIAELNAAHRGRRGPTDVLSFPVDERGPSAGPRELGDVVICPEHTEDLTEAVVHGVLHLCGYDHERDDGEMLALQRRVLEAL